MGTNTAWGKNAGPLKYSSKWICDRDLQRVEAAEGLTAHTEAIGILSTSASTALAHARICGEPCLAGCHSRQFAGESFFAPSALSLYSPFHN
mmetsp:Transcript_33043/g.71913  ORF Transcript_33043/g.71913 Transcript_33043/m.71913 type:complete len:92 (+) Transcript_33043:37-312(+)